IRLCERLEQGTPLSEALVETKGRLPRTMGALVEAGMESGRLDSVVEYCVGQVQRAASLRQRIWIAMTYPLFLMMIAGVVCSFLLIVVVPQFRTIFQDFGTELPGLTIAIIDLSAYSLEMGWIPWLTIFVLLCLVIVAAGTKFGQRLSTSIP